MHSDLIIRHAQVIDGSGSPRFRADVAVEGDRIRDIGDLGAAEAEVTLDGTGCILAPGLIDVHTHDDRALIDDRQHRCKTSQGVTTVVTGNCGFSLAPLRPRGSLPKEFRLLGETADYRYGALEDYMAALDRAPAAVNAALLVGHATLRAGVMDEFDRPASDGEIASMRGVLTDSLAAGAFGFSTGLEYAPAKAAPTAEIIGVAEALSGTGAVYTTHTRDYSNDIDAAMEEAFLIGREAGARVILSHHQGDGPRNYGHAQRTLARYDRARENQPVGMDVYPYNAASTVIDYGFVRDAERVLIAYSEPHPDAGGRDLDQIAAEWGVDQEEACRRLSPGAATYFCQDEGDVRRILAHPHSMIGSDGIPGGRSTHPRLWGSFPRVLGHYARDLGILSLEEAIRKMTSLPAEQFGLAGRGRIARGMAADLVLFDPVTVRDRASFEHPTRPSEGIRATIVNGIMVCRDGMPTGALSGRALRRSALGRSPLGRSPGLREAMQEPVRIEKHDALWEITLDRPKANAIDTATSLALASAFIAFRDEPSARVAILTAAGSRFFSAGWDLKDAAESENADDYGPGGFAGLTELFDLEKPIIAAINGLTVGGGFEMALACDLLIAAEGVEFFLPEAGIGVIPDAGGILRLPRRLPRAIAMEMMLTGKRLTAAEARHYGLLNEVVAPAELMPAARRLAERVLAAAPLAAAAIKASVAATEALTVEAGFALLRRGGVPAYQRLRQSDDYFEGARAFAEKRKPVWRGR